MDLTMPLSNCATRYAVKVTPGGRVHDEARTIWNGMIDRRPAIVARCLTANDIRPTPYT
jgi:hypothetical protein